MLQAATFRQTFNRSIIPPLSLASLPSLSRESTLCARQDPSYLSGTTPADDSDWNVLWKVLCEFSPSFGSVHCTYAYRGRPNSSACNIFLSLAERVGGRSAVPLRVCRPVCCVEWGGGATVCGGCRVGLRVFCLGSVAAVVGVVCAYVCVCVCHAVLSFLLISSSSSGACVCQFQRSSIPVSIDDRGECPLDISLCRFVMSEVTQAASVLG